MSIILSIVGTLFGASVLNMAAPVINAVFAVIRGVIGVVGDLSQSSAGRMFLLLCLIVGGLFYGRYHCIEQGRAMESTYRAQLVKAEVAKQCPAGQSRKRR